jgi:hypothetical protein
VRQLKGKELEQVLALRKNFVDRYLTVYFKRGAVWKVGMPVASKGAPPLPVTVLQCKRSFPANAKVSLVWGEGIASASGIATDKAQSLHFKTRPDFTARFSCERSDPRSSASLPAHARAVFRARERGAVRAMRLGGGKTMRRPFRKRKKRRNSCRVPPSMAPSPCRPAWSDLAAEPEEG